MDLEAERGQQPYRRQDARLVGIPDRDEHRARARQIGAAADLALGEGDLEGSVDAHHLAGRFHLRAQHGVDAGEAREREHRFLDRAVLNARRPSLKLARLSPAMMRAAILATGNADHLGDEGHRARGARIDLQHVDVAVLDGVLHVHQPADIERERERAGLPLEFGDGLLDQGMRRQRAGRIAGMNAGFLDVLHDAGDEGVLAVAQAIDVHLGGVGQIAVDQQRTAFGNRPIRHGRSRSPASLAT